jgi:subtilase family serine protease
MGVRVNSALGKAVAIASLFVVGGCAGAPAGGASPPLRAAGTQAPWRQPSATAYAANVRRACDISPDPDVVHCDALVRTDAVGGRLAGYSPLKLQDAYDLPSETNGSGQTVALVDAFDDRDAESDLGVYRSHYGLPACTTSNGCFRKVNEMGQQGPYPKDNAGWAFEESIDLDMVSAICPNCHIILVEANSAALADVGTSVDTAVQLGANAISNSYGGGGNSGEQYYDHPGVIITASAGDNGYGVGIPAGFPTVVSVGGTSLSRAKHTSRRWTETAWTGTGSGCEKKFAKPAWQTDTGCKGRTMNDVAAVADPNTGVAVYDTERGAGGWNLAGGTSVSSPIVAAAYALAGNESLLDAAQSLYVPGASLWDITSGSDGTCSPAYLCTAGTGYDGPTGNGTPNGVGAF